MNKLQPINNFFGGSDCDTNLTSKEKYAQEYANVYGDFAFVFWSWKTSVSFHSSFTERPGEFFQNYSCVFHK